MLNLNSKTSYHVFDEYGMLIIPNNQSWEKRSWWEKIWDRILKREWIPTWSNESWRDSVGRTVLAWIAYGRSKELQEAIEKCYNPKYPLAKYSLRRHPFWQDCASRDHWSYFIIYRRLRSDDYWFQCFALSIPRMRGMNYWMKALAGNKRAEWLYYTLYIPGAYLGNWWLRFCRWEGRISEEFDNRIWMSWDIYAGCLVCEDILSSHTPWQKLWSWIIFTSMPAYALHNKAWQIFVMRESRRKERLKKILLKRVGKSNIMLRLLFGDTTVTQEEVNNYPHMTGYRPGVYLDETCRRDIREMTPEESEFNSYEYDLIKYLWDESL